MHSIQLQRVIALVALGSLTYTFGAGAAIGVAMATGSFQIDRADVKGNASLFEGSEVRTQEASSKLRINGGARVELGPESRAKVYSRRVVLEAGAGQVESPSPYGLETRTLRITPDGKAIARVQLDGPEAVLVSAVHGAVRVANGSGLLIARLAEGRSLRFLPQAGPQDAFDLSGCLLKKQGKFVIVDQTSNQIFELRGPDLTPYLGNRVEVKGRNLPETAVAGAAGVVLVTSSTQVAPGGCLATAAAVNADPLPGTSVQTGPEAAKKGVNKAVIAGVIVGIGAAAGVGVALSGKSKSP